MHYDPAKEVTVSATIQEVRQIPCDEQSRFTGTHLIVKTDDREMEVMLGPTEFVDKQKFEMKAGDKVEITAVETQFAGKPALLAREVKKGEEVLTLREKNGRPMWAGGRHHGACWHSMS
jgi:hypothetical protein